MSRQQYELDPELQHRSDGGRARPNDRPSGERSLGTGQRGWEDLPIGCTNARGEVPDLHGKLEYDRDVQVSAEYVRPSLTSAPEEVRMIFNFMSYLYENKNHDTIVGSFI